MAEGKPLAQVVREATQAAVGSRSTEEFDAAFRASLGAAGYVLVSRSTAERCHSAMAGFERLKREIGLPRRDFEAEDGAALAELDRVLGDGPTAG